VLKLGRSAVRCSARECPRTNTLSDIHHVLDRAAWQIEILKKLSDNTVKLRRAIDGMLEWAEKYGMAFNVVKCKVMHLGLGIPPITTIQ
jgi:hypothetical protein